MRVQREYKAMHASKSDRYVMMLVLCLYESRKIGVGPTLTKELRRGWFQTSSTFLP